MMRRFLLVTTFFLASCSALQKQPLSFFSAASIKSKSNSVVNLPSSFKVNVDKNYQLPFNENIKGDSQFKKLALPPKI